MPRPLRHLSDDQLTWLFRRCDHDPAARKIILDEARRRDTSDKDRAWWADMKERWMEMAHAQYIAAGLDPRVKGNMLSADGERELASEFPALWEGGEVRARRLASPEMNEWWDDPAPGHARITVSMIAEDDKLSTNRDHIEQQYERNST
jgi:hypothetical protein